MDGGGRRREGDGRSDEMIWDHIDEDDASLPKKWTKSETHCTRG